MNLRRLPNNTEIALLPGDEDAPGTKQTGETSARLAADPVVSERSRARTAAAQAVSRLSSEMLEGGYSLVIEGEKLMLPSNA